MRRSHPGRLPFESDRNDAQRDPIARRRQRLTLALREEADARNQRDPQVRPQLRRALASSPGLTLATNGQRSCGQLVAYEHVWLKEEVETGALARLMGQHLQPDDDGIVWTGWRWEPSQ